MFSIRTPYPTYQQIPYTYDNYYRNHKYRYSLRNNQKNNYKKTNKSDNFKNEKAAVEKGTYPKDTIEKTTRTFENDAPLFEILGIKLYFDDILLICILFFLYQEGIQDEYLFIALILLLLS